MATETESVTTDSATTILVPTGNTNETENVITEIDNSENYDTVLENYEDFDFDEQNAKLEERLNSLKQTMGTLKEQLIEEKEAWKKEIEDAVSVAKLVGLPAPCDHECCKGDSVGSKKDTDLESNISEPTLSEITILDYEQKLANYQEALTKAHTEKRNLLKRQLAANAYKRRLLEVENMCNMELLKVKQNVQYLQPLQALASGWDSISMTENLSKFDDELTGKLTKVSLDSNGSKSNLDGSKNELVTIENLEQKLFADFKEITSQISPLSSHATCSSLCIMDEDDLMSKRIQSMNWYNNETVHHSAFNPLM